jgi:hypothetical protein
MSSAAASVDRGDGLLGFGRQRAEYLGPQRHFVLEEFIEVGGTALFAWRNVEAEFGKAFHDFRVVERDRQRLVELFDDRLRRTLGC